jgi:hypothetical protein
MRRVALAVIGLGACLLLGGLAACTDSSPQTAAKSAVRHDFAKSAAHARMPGSPLYGTTVDDVAHLRQIVDGLRQLPRMPTTRIYFDVNEPAKYYEAPVSQLRPVSYLMGELLDSADETRITTAAYSARVKSYVAAFKDQIDLWEIGNEVNGNWTGRYPTVEAKLTTAYDDVAAAHERTALTLYYNVGCGDGPAELDPIAFSRVYVPSTVRNGLSFVLLSYYEDNCNGIRPGAGTWKTYFAELHTLYPHALLGFGEVGMNNPATARTLGKAESLARYYYGLGIKLPYYVGGYFWWYFYEDCLPYQSKPLWITLQAGFQSEATRLGNAVPAQRAAGGAGTATPG